MDQCSDEDLPSPRPEPPGYCRMVCGGVAGAIPESGRGSHGGYVPGVSVVDTIMQLVSRRAFSGEKYSFSIMSIACILLITLASASGGCLNFIGNSSNNLTAEDAAFLKASGAFPMGKWDAANMAELQGDYQSMYRIAEAQKELYEKRIYFLPPMPVSDLFLDIKNEYCVSDEYGLIACEYEMKRALAFMESNYTAEEEYWGIENNAMDESLKHLFLAKKLYIERYGLF